MQRGIWHRWHHIAGIRYLAHAACWLDSVASPQNGNATSDPKVTMNMQFDSCSNVAP